MTPTLKRAVIIGCAVFTALVLWFSWMFRYAPMMSDSGGVN
ncbi:hypothetical protein [Burkholderia sp. Ac-20365]|nr:hypothetical protein [Burkholderia sp. Ac-20365]